jgi:hypothetical protein
MERQISRFRSKVEAHFGGRPGPGDRYPEGLRGLAVEVAAAELARGRRLGEVAEALGVGAATMRRWLGSVPGQGSCLRAVEVIQDEEGIDKAEPAPAVGLTLITAAGHRIEGLALAEVALLLETLA